jgi:hypothetical protein
MSYAPLVQRLTELRAAAKHCVFPQFRHCCPEHDALAKLATPAHEMAACCEALVTMHDAVRRMTPGHVANPETEFAYCDGCKAMSDAESALAELAKALGVEVTA